MWRVHSLDDKIDLSAYYQIPRKAMDSCRVVHSFDDHGCICLKMDHQIPRKSGVFVHPT